MNRPTSLPNNFSQTKQIFTKKILPNETKGF